MPRYLRSHLSKVSDASAWFCPASNFHSFFLIPPLHKSSASISFCLSPLLFNFQSNVRIHDECFTNATTTTSPRLHFPESIFSVRLSVLYIKRGESFIPSPSLLIHACLCEFYLFFSLPQYPMIALGKKLTHLLN